MPLKLKRLAVKRERRSKGGAQIRDPSDGQLAAPEGSSSLSVLILIFRLPYPFNLLGACRPVTSNK